VVTSRNDAHAAVMEVRRTQRTIEYPIIPEEQDFPLRVNGARGLGS
jgi:hypothetical protein